MMDTDTAAVKQRGRPFQKGQSGNPAGRPKGSRHAVTIMAENLLDGQAEALIAKATEMALGGDVAALRLCVERIIPPRRDKPIAFELPSISNGQQFLEKRAPRVSEEEREKIIKMLIEKISGGKPLPPLDESYIERVKRPDGQKIFGSS